MKHTKNTINQIVKMTNEKKSLKEISETLNLPKTSIFTIQKRMGLRNKVRGSVDQTKFNLVKTLIEAEIPISKIAEIAKFSSSTVANIKESSSLEDYKNRLVEEARQARLKKMAKLEKIEPIKHEVIQESSAKFDRYNSILVKLGALEYQVAKLTKLIEDTQVKKFRLF